MKNLVVVGLAATLAGCVTTRHTLIDPLAEPFPPCPPDSVRILTDASELDSLEYTRIAIIEATGSGELTDQSEMLEAMREKAGKLGANAILLPEIQEPGAGAKVAAAFFGTDTERKGTVIAIRITGRIKELWFWP